MGVWGQWEPDLEAPDEVCRTLLGVVVGSFLLTSGTDWTGVTVKERRRPYLRRT